MQVKKFEAPTLQEALDTVKTELGPEAIILQTKQHKRGFGLMSKQSVEITAAVSERSLTKKKTLEARLPDLTKKGMQKLKAEKQANLYDKFMDKHLEKIAKQTKDQIDVKYETYKPKTTTRYVDIKDDGEIKTPRIDSVDAGAQALLPQTALSTPALLEGFENLVVSGVDKRLALNFIRKVGFELGVEKSKNLNHVLDQLTTEILESFETLNLFEESTEAPRLLALVGTTGVGKTTTIAKMVGDVLKKNLKVGILNFDYNKPTSFDQSATYAKLLNVPFRSASSLEDFKASLSDFGRLDVIFVDTPGYAQKDQDSLKDLQRVLGGVGALKTMLVLSGTTRDREMLDVFKHFSVFNPCGLILTKLDEATLYGSLLNIYHGTKLPFVYFGVGQKIPDDLEVATKERVVSLIMDL